MKKLASILCLVFLLASCGGTTNEEIDDNQNQNVDLNIGDESGSGEIEVDNTDDIDAILDDILNNVEENNIEEDESEVVLEDESNSGVLEDLEEEVIVE